MDDERSARQRLIEKLSDQMDPDNAAAFVDEVIREAINAANSGPSCTDEARQRPKAEVR